MPSGSAGSPDIQRVECMCVCVRACIYTNIKTCVHLISPVNLTAYHTVLNDHMPGVEEWGHRGATVPAGCLPPVFLIEAPALCLLLLPAFD